MTAPLVAEIVDAIDAIDADPTVGAVVVTGAAPAFCSGADVKALAAMAAGTEEPADVRDIYAGFLRVLDSPLPTIAAVNGPAVGAGFNLALACDVRIAGTSASSTPGSSASGSIPAAAIPGCWTGRSGPRPPRP